MKKYLFCLAVLIPLLYAGIGFCEGVKIVSSSTELTDSEHSFSIVNTGTATTVTLMPATGSRARVTITNATGSALTVDPFSTDTIMYSTGSAGTTITSAGATGEAVEFCDYLSGYWAIEDMTGTWSVGQ